MFLNRPHSRRPTEEHTLGVEAVGQGTVRQRVREDGRGLLTSQIDLFRIAIETGDVFFDEFQCHQAIPPEEDHP